eukprot:gene5775-7973_t
MSSINLTPAIVVLLIFSIYLVYVFKSGITSVNGVEYNRNKLHLKRSNGNFNYKNLTVVIARYNESLDHLSWLSNYSHVIYSRSYISREENNLNIVLENKNVGKEAYIYLKFITENYDNLPEIIVFSQAKHDGLHWLHFTNKDFKESIIKISTNKYHFNHQNDGFAFLLPVCVPFDGGLLAHKKLHIILNQRTWESWAMEYYSMKKVFFQEYLKFEVEYPRFAPTGCFAVSKSTILRNSRKYYLSLLGLLSKEKDPKIGHWFERGWPEVFHSNCSAFDQYYCTFDVNELHVDGVGKYGCNSTVLGKETNYNFIKRDVTNNHIIA